MENRKELVHNIDNILISIVIIVRNEANRIERCIESLIRQAGIENCEILFIDGNSTDNTTFVINQYIEKYGNIRLIKCRSYGYSYQRNVGVAHAKGEYILFISGDTVCESKLILKYKKAIIKNYEVIQGTVIQEGDENKTKILYKFYKKVMMNYLEEISTVNLLIKKTLFQKHMFDERIIAFEDKIWFLTMDMEIRYYRMKNGMVYHFVHETIGQYSRKIHKEAIGVGMSLVLNRSLWRKHNYFGWLSFSIYGCFVLAVLFIILFVYIFVEDNLFVLCVDIVVLFSYEIYKGLKYRFFENDLKGILILERYLFSAQTGIIKGVVKALISMK